MISAIIMLALSSAPCPVRVAIAPLYSGSLYFTGRYQSTDTVTVRGAIRGFIPRREVDIGTYRQRFVGMDGRFRVIHIRGIESATVVENNRRRNSRRSVATTAKFDALGFFAEKPYDPVDLLPLYAGHAVRVGESWRPDAPVSTAFGTGTAHYWFRLIRLQCSADGHILAFVTFHFDTALVPSAPLRAARISGSGSFVWDCTVQQRRAIDIAAMYEGRVGANSVSHRLVERDQLEAHHGRMTF